MEPRYEMIKKVVRAAFMRLCEVFVIPLYLNKLGTNKYVEGRICNKLCRVWYGRG